MPKSSTASGPPDGAEALPEVEVVHGLYQLGSDRERRAFPVEAWPLWGAPKPAWKAIIGDARERIARWAGSQRWVLHKGEGEVVVESGVPVLELLVPLWSALAPEGMDGIPLVGPGVAEAILEERGVPVSQRTLRARIESGVVGVRLVGRSRGRLWLPLPVVAFGAITARGWSSFAARDERIERELAVDLLDALRDPPDGYTVQELAALIAPGLSVEDESAVREVWRWADGQVVPNMAHLARLHKAGEARWGASGWFRHLSDVSMRKRVSLTRAGGGGA